MEIYKVLNINLIETLLQPNMNLRNEHWPLLSPTENWISLGDDSKSEHTTRYD